MHDPTGQEFQRRLDRLEARADRLKARLAALGGLDPQVPPGMYALVMKVDDYEFLMDPALLGTPPRVRVRRGLDLAEFWVDYDDVSPTAPGTFSRFEERRVLRLIVEHLEELRSAWFDLREDCRRGRLRERHMLVD